MQLENQPERDAPVKVDLMVSAVVVNYNGGERILKTVEALLNQPFPLEDIVICDNDSTDGTPDQIRQRFPQVRVHPMGCNDGLPKARNTGMRLVQSDLVLLVDNDVYVQPETIERMMHARERTGATVVCPRIRLVPEHDTVQAEGASCHFLGTMTLRHAYQPVESLPVDTAEVGGCIGACYLVDRAKVLEAGGFDEVYFFYFEDLEFALRMRALGYRFVAEPSAEVYHERGAGTPGLSFRGTEQKYPVRRMYLSMRHRLLTMFICYRVRTLLVLMPVLVLYEGAGLTAAALNRCGWQWFRAWGWVLAKGGLIRQRRRRLQRERCVTDRELLEGGPIPLAPGLVGNRMLSLAVTGFSRLCNAYWAMAKHVIG